MVKADADRLGSKNGNFMDTLMNILSIKNINQVDLTSTLNELGMDSLVAVEVQQALESQYDLVLSVEELRKMKISDVSELKLKMADEDKVTFTPHWSKPELIMSIMEMPVDQYMALNQVTIGKPIFFLPPLFSGFSLLLPLAKCIDRPCIGLNWTKDFNEPATLEDVAGQFIDVIQQLEMDTGNYDLVGYSMGAIIAFEMAIQLVEDGRPLHSLTLLDGSPEQARTDITNYFRRVNDGIIAQSATLMLDSISSFFPFEMKLHNEELLHLATKAIVDERIAGIFSELTGQRIDGTDIDNATNRIIRKMEMLCSYQPRGMYDRKLLLIQAAEATEIFRLPANYNLFKISSDHKIVAIPGNHGTLLLLNPDDIGRTIGAWSQAEGQI